MTRPGQTNPFVLEVEVDGHPDRVRIWPDLPCGGFDIKLHCRNPKTGDLEHHLTVQGEVDRETGIPLITAIKVNDSHPVSTLLAGFIQNKENKNDVNPI